MYYNKMDNKKYHTENDVDVSAGIGLIAFSAITKSYTFTHHGSKL
jgi:hypothetical protein